MTARRICFPFIGDSVGGSQISAAILIDALDRSRYMPRVILHEPGPLADYLNERSIEFEYLPVRAYIGPGHGAFANAGHLAMMTPVLGRFLKRRGMSIVHTQDGRMNQTWGLAARLGGIRFIWHQRSMYAPSRLTRLAMTLANRVICNSGFVRQGLPSRVREAALVLENPFETDGRPLDRDEARGQLLHELGLSEDAQAVAFIGNLTAQKRPEVFLRAAAEIRDGTGTPIQFLIFGRDRDGLQSRLAALAKELGIGDAVHFMGFRDPIAPWLAAADLLLAPEVDDAFGRTLVEAMLAGTPVVASDSGGHREIIESGKTGLLTPPDGVSDMAATALSLLRDPRRSAEISHRAREAAIARYAISAHAAAIMDIYDQLPSTNN
jgi:glycosyltransferase involved in cell wall biosynthesis